MAADRLFHFGLLTLQNGLIQQAQLVAAFHAWTCDKSRSLAGHLIALGKRGRRLAHLHLARCHVVLAKTRAAAFGNSTATKHSDG